MTYVGSRPANKAVTTSDIEDDAITSAKIATGTVVASDLGANSVDSSELVDGSIDTSHLGALQVTEAKIANDAITLAKMASGTDGNIISYDASGNPVAIATGSDGQVLTSTGAGSPPAFEAIPASAFVKVGDVQSNSAASSHDLTGIFSDTYDKYFFSLSTYPATAGKELEMQFLDGSNNPVTSSYYGASYGRNHSGTSVSHSGASVSSVIMSNGMSGDRAFQCQGYIIGATSGITSNKQVQWYAGQWDASNNYEIQVGGYFHTSATDYTGMRILSNGVNITAISLQVYGIVDTKNYNG